MAKSNIDMSKKPQIIDIYGNKLNSGDVLIYISSFHRKSSGLCAGVFLNHFDNGSGWKMRIRAIKKSWYGANKEESGDNTLILRDGCAHGAIRVSDPSNSTHREFIRDAYKLQQKLFKSKKIEVTSEEPKTVWKLADTTEKSSVGEVDASDLLSSLGAPKSLKNG